ncbi:MFS transporter [Alcaligenaceae bacterium C4P045]|nr:MFS transporter [Alcaligenaceae bacterium C4P045]
MTSRRILSTPAALFAVFAIILVGLNLRPALAAVGPLLDAIRASTGLSFQAAGWATSLPILAMGVLALGGAALYAIGMRRGIAIGVALILIASVLRIWFDTTTGLLLTAALAGIGIGAVQTLMPGYIKYRFPQGAERVMGLYVTAIMGGAALAAMTAPTLLPAIGWQYALAACAVPAVLALAAWFVATRTRAAMPAATAAPQPRAASIAPQPVHPARRLRTWALACVFGIETACYTLLLAWLAPFYLERGWSAFDAGALLAGLTVFEVIAGLTISTVAARFPDRRGPLLVCMGLGVAGFAGLIFAPDALAWPAVACLGLGVGALFPLTLILTLDHSSRPERAGVLTGFVQGIGYLIAGSMPFAAGLLRDELGTFTAAWGVIAVALLAAIPLTVRFSPRSIARFEPAPASTPVSTSASAFNPT